MALTSTKKIAGAEHPEVKKFMKGLVRRNKGEKEFIQAVREVAEVIVPFLDDYNPRYKEVNMFERICEPERVFIFRVPWIDDKGGYRINRGYRIQMNSAIGPYKGGLRLHPSVNLSILKFLAFEQIFKNSLTTLPMGAGKGGADFNPKGKSDNEVMRFCQSYMTELVKYIGPNVDIPAGDIGTGAREIGYMFGQYKRIKGGFEGVLTGKGLAYGGSLIRSEATGYGSVYFAHEMLKTKNKSFRKKICAVSGSGNVAQYTCEKLIELGGKVVTMSDSGGTIYDKSGINTDKLQWIMDLKNNRRGRLSEYADHFKGVKYMPDSNPWSVPCDMAFPSATQNELGEDDAKLLVKNGCILVSEGANMPCTPEAVEVFQAKKILYGPGKAANAGGVAVSGLEMSQNSLRFSWTREEVDAKLRDIMINIHSQTAQWGKSSKKNSSYIDYVRGANIAGFIKVADAMDAQGLV
ncbi:MAG: glutamate dehydrogenase (NADP+) [Limisphaerales bacterium]|jgi:glutamate dehydrogenase (NADP+)